MADQEIKTIYKVEDQGTDELVRVSRGQQEVGDSAEKTAEQQGELENKMSELQRTLATLAGAGGALAVAQQAFDALTARIAAQNEELQRNAELSRQAIDASINARFLGQRPEDVANAETLAAQAGRDPNAGVRALASIASRRPGASQAEQFDLFQQAIDLSQFDPTAGLDAFVNPLLTVQQFERDPAAAQNIVFESIRQAGVTDPTALSPLFAQFLGIGTSDAVGLSAGEAAGSVAAATGLGLDPSQSVTSLRNLALLLQGKGSPEGRAVIEANQIRGGDLFATLRNLSGAFQSGRIDQTDLESIFGRENVTLAASLVEPGRLNRFLASARAVGAAQTDPTNRVVERFGEVRGQEPRTIAADVERVAEAETTLLRSGDEVAANAAAARDVIAQTLEEARQRGDVTAAQVAAIVPDGGDGIFDRLVAEGFSPAEAAVLVEQQARVDDFDFTPGVNVDVSSAVLRQLGGQAFRSTGATVRSGAISRANQMNRITQTIDMLGIFGGGAASRFNVAAELSQEAEAQGIEGEFDLGRGVTIIGQQFNSTPPPGETDNGRRREGVAE